MSFKGKRYCLIAALLFCSSGYSAQSGLPVDCAEGDTVCKLVLKQAVAATQDTEAAIVVVQACEGAMENAEVINIIMKLEHGAKSCGYIETKKQLIDGKTPKAFFECLRDLSRNAESRLIDLAVKLCS